jgi:lipoprotein-anchoring transpeptidase ErfK/SrfK
MWWGGMAQDGWGVALLQQYRALFAVWFTYDASGAPTWLVMPSGDWTDAQTYAGRIYRTHGSPWPGASYDASKLQTTDVGSFRLRFAGDGATFNYVVDGQGGSLPLARQPF